MTITVRSGTLVVCMYMDTLDKRKCVLTYSGATLMVCAFLLLFSKLAVLWFYWYQILSLTCYPSSASKYPDQMISDIS